MGRSMLWIPILSALFMIDSTSGIRCLSCKAIKNIADCHHVITCAQGSICHAYYQNTFGIPGLYDLSCMPRSHCPSRPAFTSGFGLYFTGCCDDADVCVLRMPELFPPKVTHLDPPIIQGSTLLELHSTTYLSCYGNSSIYVNHAWLYNGGSTLPPHASAHNSSSNGAYLEIRDITRSEVGNYTCIISKDGVTASASVMVSVIEANSPMGIITFDANRPITNGKMVLALHDSALIDCHSQRNDVTFAWQFNGSSTLPPSVQTTGANLHITFMEGAQVGSYTCITSKNGLASSASVWVTVKEEKPRVTQLTASPSHPGTNHRLDVVCHVKGFPEPTILWNFRDPMGQSYMPPGSSNLTPDKVHIENFQPSLHSGTWTCMARNSLGVDQMSIQI